MSSLEVVALVVLAVLLLAVIWWGVNARRRHELQERFGREYERAVETTGNRRAAEKELAARTARHEQLHITQLAPDRRERFVREWSATQARFVDRPPDAVAEADRLVQQVMEEPGLSLRRLRPADG